jgi:hypothetical protein
MGRVWIGWTENPTRRKIELGEKLDPHSRVKFQTHALTRRVSSARRVFNGLTQSSLGYQNGLNEQDQMHHSNNSFQSQV